jgi:hypothetical protein
MGWLRKAAKWVAKKVKAVARFVVRVVMTFVGLGLGIVDIFFGWAAWPPKKLRLHIVVLSNQSGPLVTEKELGPAIEYARTRLKSRFGVKLLPYSPNMIQILDTPAPQAALNVGCNGGAFGDEFGDAGDFFAQHLAGWNSIPVSLTFPITVFIVENVAGKQGCSLGPLTDYVTVDPDGVATPSLMTHEILHACNLLGHPVGKRNLQYAGHDRGDEVNWFQKNVFRSSRHVTYW